MSKNKKNAYRVVASGSYRTASGDIIDFEDVEGFIPANTEEVAIMHVRGRHIVDWIKAAVKEGTKDERRYPQRIDSIRQVFVDEIEEVSHDFSYIGKDIKKMSYEELQDLAAAKDLRRIPLPKELSGTSLREARERAYLDYSEYVLRDPVEPNDKDVEGHDVVNYAKLEPLEVDGEMRADKTLKISNEEMIEQEQASKSTDAPKTDLTIKDLREMADKKGITYHPNIGFDKLYAKLYGSAP